MSFDYYCCLNVWTWAFTGIQIHASVYRVCTRIKKMMYVAYSVYMILTISECISCLKNHFYCIRMEWIQEQKKESTGLIRSMAQIAPKWMKDFPKKLSVIFSWHHTWFVFCYMRARKSCDFRVVYSFKWSPIIFLSSMSPRRVKDNLKKEIGMSIKHI